jgi:hypothetical protein
MRHVRREELLDYVTYDEKRGAVRNQMMTVKSQRRVHVGEHLTFLFENTDTIRYQIQEMMRAERMVREADIEHELETYNGLLGSSGELGATLLIEIDDPEERAVKLRAWLELPQHLYARLPDGRRVRPTFDPSQVGEDRLSSVQYLKFEVGPKAPVAFGCDHPQLAVETQLTAEQRAALQADLTTD